MIVRHCHTKIRVIELVMFYFVKVIFVESLFLTKVYADDHPDMVNVARTEF